LIAVLPDRDLDIGRVDPEDNIVVVAAGPGRAG